MPNVLLFTGVVVNEGCNKRWMRDKRKHLKREAMDNFPGKESKSWSSLQEKDKLPAYFGIILRLTYYIFARFCYLNGL